jgi:hypothetical protein
LKIGNNYINTSQIKRIRPLVKPNDSGHYVEVEMLDGSIVDGYCHEDRVTMLTRHYLPAAPGIEVSTWAHDASTSRPVAYLQKEILVGFAFDGFDELCPVTVESGVIEGPYNLTLKDGRVRASWGETFDSEAEMIEAAGKRFTQAAA